MNRRRFLGRTTGFLCSLASSSAIATAENQIKAGQLLLTGFRGTTSSDPEVDALRRYIENGDVAGVILLERNITSPDQLAALTRDLQEASKDLPIIVSIDQEGGAVTRVGPKNGFREWESAANLGFSGRNNGEILDYYTLRAQELASVGINLNLGPVADLNVNPSNPIIGMKGRAFGSDVETVTRFSELFVRAHRSAQVKTCLKHFPGHGSSWEDSHQGTVDVSRTWTAAEISPFERLVRADLADMLMTAHLLHKHLSDEPGIPTSLSKRTLEEIRQGLGFSGPIVTDDMQMKGVTDLVSSLAEAGIQAVHAGNSLLIYSNYEDRYRIDTVLEIGSSLTRAINEGRLSLNKVEEQVEVSRDFRSTL